MRILIVLLLIGAPLAAHSQAQVNRCERGGRITFSDAPCEAGAKVSRKEYETAGATGALDMHVAVTHYPVEGKDMHEVFRSLNGRGPNGYHGLASWRVRYEYTMKRQKDLCQVASVVTRVNGEILMPRWVDEPSAPRALQQRWADIYARLKWHEDGHGQHGRELGLLVKERLMGIGAVPCDRVGTLAENEFQRLYSNLKARDQEYDKRTNHGLNQ